MDEIAINTGIFQLWMSKLFTQDILMYVKHTSAYYNHYVVDLYNNYVSSLPVLQWGLDGSLSKNQAHPLTVVDLHPTPGLTFSVQDFLQDKQNNGQQCERRDFFFIKKNHHKGSCFIGGTSIWCLVLRKSIECFIASFLKHKETRPSPVRYWRMS